ncbi:hypothetical protein SH449x_002456 [Pirellulaceae bacterium SH449]
MSAATKNFRLVKDLATEIYGHTPHNNTIQRWIRGITVNGQKRALRAVRLNNKFYTTEQWLREFLEIDNSGQQHQERPPTDTQVKRAQSQAEQICEELGV